MNPAFIIWAGLVALLPASSARAACEGWSTDFPAAQKLAAESHKDLLINFTGYWCPACRELRDEVFLHDEFKRGVADTFVLVEIEHPLDTGKLGPVLEAQNEALEVKYAINAFPSVVLCDAAGRPYAGAIYEEGGAQTFVDSLNAQRGRKTRRDEVFASAAQVEGPARARALIGALEAMNLGSFLNASFYGDVVAQIQAADPKTESAFAQKLFVNQRVYAFDRAMDKFFAAKNLEGALALVDQTIKEGGFDVDTVMRMKRVRAKVFFGMHQWDEALRAVEEAKAFAPDNEIIWEFDELRKQIERKKEDAAGRDYVVRPGDTPAKIARKRGISREELDAANPGVDWSQFRVGQKLWLPEKK